MSESWQTAWHVGRSWEGHPLEDGCPCPQAPCGLVYEAAVVNNDCPEHSLEASRSLRQGHRAEDCPALGGGCPVVYDGSFWTPRPCVKSEGHDGFHVDRFGRTWSEQHPQEVSS